MKPRRRPSPFFLSAEQRIAESTDVAGQALAALREAGPDEREPLIATLIRAVDDAREACFDYGWLVGRDDLSKRVLLTMPRPKVRH